MNMDESCSTARSDSMASARDCSAERATLGLGASRDLLLWSVSCLVLIYNRTRRVRFVHILSRALHWRNADVGPEHLLDVGVSNRE
jgi:hypothetical protein